MTYSELDTYRQCPLKHKWSYKDRWVKPPEVGSPLSRGSLWHLVMECHYTWLQRFPNDPKVNPAFLKKWIDQHLLYDEAGNQNEDQELVEWMYDGYLDCYGVDPDWSLVQIESANQVELPQPEGGQFRTFNLRFKNDLLIRSRKSGQLWLVDHKSARDFTRQTEIDVDDQFGLYTWALRKLGFPVVGTIRSDARTQRNKSPMTLEQRFRRVSTYRTDQELENIARDAYATASAAWGDTPLHSSPAPDRCFTGDTLLAPIGDLHRVSRRWYNGSVVRVKTANGKEFTGTAKHPILTDRGWVPIDQLAKGDRVVRTDFEEVGVGGTVANDQQRYIKASELFNSAQGVLDTGVSCEFHGEPTHEEVDVVTVDRSLGSVRHSPVSQPPGELSLVFSDGSATVEALLSANGYLASGIVRQRSDMGLPEFAESLPVSGTPMAGSNFVGFGGSTRLEPTPDQVLRYRAATYAKSYRQGRHAFLVNEPFDEVVEVEFREFSGHVYNLQTSTGSYSANGTTVLNCSWRCDFLQAHLMFRKGVADEATILSDFGFSVNEKKHREYETDSVLDLIPTP